MQIICKQFLKMIQKCGAWYCHVIYSEATQADIDEWFEEQERQHAEEEAEGAKRLADYIQLQELAIADKHSEEEEYVRLEEEDRKFHEEWAEREKLNEMLRNEQEEDRYRCPLCGTRWVSFGRCKACDRAFGRD